MIITEKNCVTLYILKNVLFGDSVIRVLILLVILLLDGLYNTILIR